MRPISFFICLFLSKLAFAQLNLELLAHVPNDSGSTLAGCWHYVDAGGREYALLGTRLGLDIYDVSIPTQPVRKYQVPGIANNWREVKVWNGYAYVGSEATGSGITIVDLTQVADSIRWKVWTGEGPVLDQIQRSHTVGAVDGYLYIYGGNAYSGAVICSLADPWNPVYVGNYNLNYLHDGFVRGDTLWGSEIYKGQFSVVDISDKTNPVLLANHPTPAAFNHNAELSKDGRFLFTTDEKSFAPLGAFDVSELDNITLTDVYYPSQKPASEVHNVRVYGDDYLICPSYGGQLTIVDASDPYNLIETAWAVVGTSLVWDADPYLPSGIVFATAKAEGFFIFKPTYTRAGRVQGTVRDAVSGALLPGAQVFVLNTPNADTTNMSGRFATGAPGTGDYTLLVAKAGYDTLWVNQSLVSGQTDTLHLTLFPSSVGAGPSLATVRPDIRVYPTIVSGVFTLEGDLPEAAFPLQLVHAATGATVLSVQAVGGQQRFEAPTQSGIYFVLVNGKPVGKIVVR